jgi:excisionase family DNA binding protein
MKESDMDHLSPTISVSEAATVLGVNPRTVYNSVGREGGCPAVRLGRVIRIPTLEFIAAYRLDRALVASKLAEPVPVHAA